MATRRIHTIGERLQSGLASPLLLRRYTRVVDDCVRLASSDSVSPSTIAFCTSRQVQING